MMGLFDQEKAVEQFGNEKKEEGRAEGKLEGKLEGTILFAQKLGIQQEEVKKFIMEEYDKTEEEAEELITLYWHS